MIVDKINKLEALYKKRIGKGYLEEIDKGLVTTFIGEFAKDLKKSLSKKECEG